MLPNPVKADDVLRHERGRHVAVKNRRMWWQKWQQVKHQLFWFWLIVKSEYQWFRREWFRWLEK